jgi:RNA polymerase sigma factor (sigma-70 family)
VRANILKILPNLRRFAFALTGDKHDADDLVQTTVERILIKNPPAGAALLPWAIRVCKNSWIDEIRRRKVRIATEIGVVEHDLSGDDGEQIAMSKITLQQVNSAMDALPDNQRVALSMRSVSELSYVEISEALNIPIGTVMSRISRARRALAISFGTSKLNMQGLLRESKNDLH